MGYLSMMAIVYVVMNVLAEMVTYLPMGGITVPYFVARFVDRSLAFATGWNYWYAYAILVAAEATAGSILLSYWVCRFSLLIATRSWAKDLAFAGCRHEPSCLDHHHLDHDIASQYHRRTVLWGG
jgi:amino acid permease